MNEDKAREAQEREEMRAWHETKAACDPSDWSTAESAAYRGFFVHGFRAALQWAASQQAAPEGWRLVPVEPTMEMRNRGAEVHDQRPSEVAGIYRAMLAAAPAQQAAEGSPVNSVDFWQRRGHLGEPSEWREACRLFRVRCNEHDIAVMAKLRTYIEEGLLEVKRPAAPPSTQGGADEQR